MPELARTLWEAVTRVDHRYDQVCISGSQGKDPYGGTPGRGPTMPQEEGDEVSTETAKSQRKTKLIS